MKPNTLFYGLSAEKGATINPLATQSIKLSFVMVPGVSIEEIQSGAKPNSPTADVKTIAVMDIGEQGLNIRFGKDEEPEFEVVEVIKQRLAIGLNEFMTLYQDTFKEIDLEKAPSFTEFLETCIKDKYLAFAAEEINENVIQNQQLLDIREQVRLDCVENYIKSINATQLGKGN